ncbi:hypothetical protein MMC30_006187 [Trapelia coarctata]|nr:hypothetical protein [Trapelia coarctata]
MAPSIFHVRSSVLLLLCIGASIWRLTYIVPGSSIHRLRELVHHTGSDKPLDPSAANATLGFQTILALSAEDQNSTHAWRRSGLVRAANRTNLHIEIPPQRDYTFKELKALRDGKPGEEDVDKPSEGQALAWLGHLDLLQRVIDSQTTTAFILEDDADWDVTLPDQLLDISSAIRNFTNATSPPELYPYGLDWDVLWLGHCGDLFNKSDPTNLGIHDPSMLPLDRLRFVFMDPDFYKDFPPQTRILHTASGPVCTFAYAVTLKGAKKVRNWASSTGEAFDVKLNTGCRTGALKCLSISPEVIHHQRMVGAASLSMGQGSPKKVKQVNRFETDMTPGATEFVHRLESDGSVVSPVLDTSETQNPASNRVFTHNILHSARCNWNRNDDELVECNPTDEEWEEFAT